MYHDYFSHQKGKHLTDKSKVKIVEHFVKAQERRLRTDQSTMEQ